MVKCAVMSVLKMPPTLAPPGCRSRLPSRTPYKMALEIRSARSALAPTMFVAVTTAFAQPKSAPVATAGRSPGAFGAAGRST